MNIVKILSKIKNYHNSGLNYNKYDYICDAKLDKPYEHYRKHFHKNEDFQKQLMLKKRTL